MDGILIKFLNFPEGIFLNKFLAIDRKKLNSFEQSVLRTLKEIYDYNEKKLLFQPFPKRNMPLVIDCINFRVKPGWTAVYSGAKNRIFLSHDLTGDDLKLTLIHELKHAEQWFDDTNFNNYQRHQAYCLYEILAKLFVGQFLGRGAYFGISLNQSVEKWFNKHYPNYKEKYDNQWPIIKDDIGLEELPKSFRIAKEEERQIIIILNEKVLK